MRKLNIHFVSLPPVRLKVSYIKERVETQREQRPRRIAIPVHFE
jgi:hypothetical protein